MNKEKTNNLLTITFDDYSDFLREAKKEPENTLSCSSRRASTESGFSGTRDFASAIELAEKGWSKGLKEVEKIRAEIAPLVGERVLRPVPVHSMAGYAPNVGAFLSGDPENMYYREYQETKARGKILKIGVSAGFSCGVDSKVIQRRGAIICALLDAIEQSGVYRVELWLEHSASQKSKAGNKNRIESHIKLKDSGDSFEISKFAFAIAHPSHLRRFCFSVMENNGYGKEWNPGLGFPQSSLLAESFDLYFEKLNWSDIGSNENAVSWVLSQLKDLGIQISDT